MSDIVAKIVDDLPISISDVGSRSLARKTEFKYRNKHVDGRSISTRETDNQRWHEVEHNQSIASLPTSTNDGGDEFLKSKKDSNMHSSSLLLKRNNESKDHNKRVDGLLTKETANHSFKQYQNEFGRNKDIDGFPMSVSDTGSQLLRTKKESKKHSQGVDVDSLSIYIRDRNERIENLKIRIKMLGNDGSPDQLEYLHRKLSKEFEMIDEMVKSKLNNQAKSMNPPNIIHLPTTTEEDNLPPIILFATKNEDNLRPQGCRLQSQQQKKAEEKFQQIQKKLLDLCRSSKENKDSRNNLNDDIKKQFDILYSELKVLEKELFYDDSPDFDSFENSEKKIAFQSLKHQNAMLLEQGDHFQVLFKEQQTEIENYRQKYMRTLQNVMEQHMRISSMENYSKSTEKRTYEEISRIKNNLRKKLDHLAPMSDLLENCNRKLIHTIKRKTEMEQNYEDMCEELRRLKKELANSVGGSYKSKCDHLGAELKKTKELNEFNNKRLNQMQLQLQQAKSELQRVKLKSSKTIKSTMKKCDFLRSELKSRINQLEIELAQSKAIMMANSK